MNRRNFVVSPFIAVSSADAASCVTFLYFLWVKSLPEGEIFQKCKLDDSPMLEQAI